MNPAMDLQSYIIQSPKGVLLVLAVHTEMCSLASNLYVAAYFIFPLNTALSKRICPITWRTCVSSYN